MQVWSKSNAEKIYRAKLSVYLIFYANYIRCIFIEHKRHHERSTKYHSCLFSFRKRLSNIFSNRFKNIRKFAFFSQKTYISVIRAKKREDLVAKIVNFFKYDCYFDKTLLFSIFIYVFLYENILFDRQKYSYTIFSGKRI